MKAIGETDGSARRRFLRTLGAGAVVIPVVASARSLGVAAAPDQAPEQRDGYRETAHVRAFYRSALGPR